MVIIEGKPSVNEVLTEAYKVPLQKTLDGAILFYAKNVILKELFYIKHLGSNKFYNKSNDEFVQNVLAYSKTKEGEKPNSFKEECKKYCRSLSKPELIALYYWLIATDRFFSEKVILQVENTFNIQMRNMGFADFNLVGELINLGSREEVAKSINKKLHDRGYLSFDYEKAFNRAVGRYVAYYLHDPDDTGLNYYLASTLDYICSYDYNNEKDNFLKTPHDVLDRHYHSFVNGSEIHFFEDDVLESTSTELDPYDVLGFVNNFEENSEVEEDDNFKNTQEDVDDFFESLSELDEATKMVIEGFSLNTPLPLIENYKNNENAQKLVAEWLSV